MVTPFRHSWLGPAIFLAGVACGNSASGPNAGPPVSLAKQSGDNQTGMPGQVLAPYTVLVTDANGNGVAGVSVGWVVEMGGGTLSAALSVSNGNGGASVTHTLGPSNGPNSVSASVPGLAGSPVTFTATARPGFTVLGGGNNVPDRFSSDLWVHGGYAYTGTWGLRNAKLGNALEVWQLNASGAPALIDSVITSSITTVSDVEVSADGSLLMFTAENGPNAGLHVYSLANPAHPTFVSKRTVNSGLHTGTLATIGGKLYAFTARNPSGAALLVFDLSNPASPALADSVPIPENYGIHDTFVRDGIAFVFAWNTGVIIYDVGNGIRGGSPTAPVEISRLVTSTNGVSAGPQVHNGWWFHNPVNGDKRYLFIGQEGPAQIGSHSSGDIHVVDVSNLAAPVEVAFYHMPGAGTHNFWMDESRSILYAAYYNGGVVALDVSGTLSGSLTGREIARVQPGGSGNTFTWGVQLYNGFLYASDMLSGFWQLRPPM